MIYDKRHEYQLDINALKPNRCVAATMHHVWSQTFAIIIVIIHTGYF